ncbi:MAG: hypothetical protein ACKV2V_15010 [Blastocatellia bacterium]
MARGWESKSVEDQIEEAARAREANATPATPPEILVMRERHETLTLTRSRLLDLMQRARSESHRAMLTQSLEETDRQLTQLNQLLNSGF